MKSALWLDGGSNPWASSRAEAELPRNPGAAPGSTAPSRSRPCPLCQARPEAGASWTGGRPWAGSGCAPGLPGRRFRPRSAHFGCLQTPATFSQTPPCRSSSGLPPPCTATAQGTGLPGLRWPRSWEACMAGQGGQSHGHRSRVAQPIPGEAASLRPSWRGGKATLPWPLPSGGGRGFSSKASKANIYPGCLEAAELGPCWGPHPFPGPALPRRRRPQPRVSPPPPPFNGEC